MKFSGRKILLLGFVVILLVAIPITTYLVQQQVKTKTAAVAATSLTLSPQTTTTTVGTDVTLDVNMDPGTNLVSFVKVLISYDATKLATGGAGFVANTTVFPTVLQGPIYGPDTITVTLSVGSSPQAVIQTPTKVGTVTFQTLDATDTAPTKVLFGAQTQVLSTGESDEFNENVLSSTVPATINIKAIIPTATLTLTPTTTPTLTPTLTPEPTLEPGVSPTDTPTPTPTLEPGLSPTATPIPVGGVTGPTCTSLTLDRTPAGVVPYNVNFTLVGTAGTAILSKATFNFGDGRTMDITKEMGVGDNSVNILQSHIYEEAGTFTATATVTDVNGLVSTLGSTGCSQTIIVSPLVSPSPLPPTGPTTLITFGILGAILAIIGTVLLLAL